ncbi:DNA binding domain-containing protein, excisionase family [Tenacibaculum sp. MAR_2009_124]|uniref:helix-turn-helix domain-containing protein n=1 Tax=Tenacibaculum sp. MAR_2009_124 TaxID=1250059 RepID=UPI00089D4E59|nr:helix-turn-helix domain-containing protein [Tenacibaculum sp. MAR_2009_124]SEB51392.1 DNA binding domain-containing protein, excisionase family [Tenacibaculum sp. MAR_2009_124]
MDILKISQQLDKIEKLLLSSKTVLTFDEACEYTGLKASYLYKMTASKLIPHSKPNGGKIFFDKSKLDTWLLQNENQTQSEIEKKALSYTLKNKKRG